MTAGYSNEEAFLKATGAQVTPQGTLKAKPTGGCARGENHLKTMFELVSVKCPILSVVLPVGKQVIVVMENERRDKKNREIPFTDTMVYISSMSHSCQSRAH